MLLSGVAVSKATNISVGEQKGKNMRFFLYSNVMLSTCAGFNGAVSHVVVGFFPSSHCE